MERFATKEEIQKRYEECEFATEFYKILLQALDDGKFVLFDEDENTYRIAEGMRV